MYLFYDAKTKKFGIIYSDFLIPCKAIFFSGKGNAAT